ncbi:MAG: PUA domain-containing protein, partial [bacterium]
LISGKEPLAARKQWLAARLQIKGSLQLDDGAVKVLKSSGRSLLPVGIKGVSGQFSRGDLVSCVDQQGGEIARGLVNYSAAEADKIKGRPSNEIAAILGYREEDEMIHRDNLVLV